MNYRPTHRLTATSRSALALATGLALAVPPLLAADISVRPAAGSSFAVQNSAGSATYLSVSETGAIVLPGMAGAGDRNLCVSAAGQIAPCAGGGGGGAFALPYANSVNLPGSVFQISNSGDGAVIDATNSTTTSSVAAVRGTISSTTPGGFSSAVHGVNNGTGGLGIGVWGSQGGSGWGVYGVTPSGLGVYGNSSGAGTGVYANSNTGTGLQATSNNGTAARIEIFNNANNSDALVASTLGDGNAIAASTVGKGSAVAGSSASTDSSISAIRGDIISTSPGGFSSAVRGVNNGTGGLGIGVWGSQAGSGWGVYGVTPDGLGVYGNASGGGTGVFANSNTGIGLQATSNSGIPASISITNITNNSNALQVNTSGSGHLAVFQASLTNVARISNTGAGYFNGGTFSAGADLAEIVPLADAVEAADVVEIDPSTPDRFRLSTTAHNPLVAGVISTAPGVTLGADLNHDAPRPALALAGRVPVKVTLEGGPIAIGDALTASSTPGHAMRAPTSPVPGSVIGKALAVFSGAEGDRIAMLVWPR